MIIVTDYTGKINTPEDLYRAAGIVPNFLLESDPRPMKEQIQERYIAGWHRFEGFTLDPETLAIKFPGDKPLKPLLSFQLRDEILYFYRHAWGVIMQKDGSWEAARLD